MLRLRPYKRCDAEHVVSWITDEVAFYKWSAGRLPNYPITANDLNSHYDEFADLDSFFTMTAFDETGAVGQLIMRFIDEEKKILRFGFVIVDASKRGKGYGKRMISLALQFAFKIMKVEKVTIGVFDNNPAAYHCYKSVGFTEMGEDKNETYRIMDEDWKCIELEIAKEVFEANK